MANIASLLINIGVKLDGEVKVKSELKRIRKSAKEMGRDGKVAATSFGRAFQKMGRGIRKAAAVARGAIGRLVRKMGGLRGIATVGAAAVTGAALGIYKLVESQTAALDSTNKMATALGMSVEELQRLRFIAGQSGVATSTLERAMRNVNRNMLDVASGGGKAVRENLETLGLTIEDLNGLSRTNQLGLIGERLQGIDDEARRSAISAKLFGEVAGPEMATMLAEGTAGLERLGAQAKNVFSQEDADRASAFQDRLGEVKDQVAALVTGIAIDLLPTVEDLILRLQDWLAENEELIKQKVPETLDAIVDAGRELYEVLDTIADAMRSVGIDTDAAEVAMVAFGIGAVAAINPVLGLVVATAAAVSILADAIADALGMIPDVSGSGAAYKPKRRRRLAGADLDAETKRWMMSMGMEPELPSGTGAAARRGRGAGPRKRRRGGGGGGARGGARGARGSGWLDRALAEGAELTQDAFFRMQTGLPRRGGASAVEAVEVLLSGRGAGSPLFENLQRMAARTPATKDIKPTVAMDITINQKFDNKQIITAPDPESAASKSAEAIRKVLRQETAKAGQAIAGNVVR